MELTTTQVNEITQIILNWLTIFGLVYTFIRQAKDKQEGKTSASSSFIRQSWVYFLLTIMFLSAVIYMVISPVPLTKLTVVAIASCLAGISFLIVAIAYKYILWSMINHYRNLNQE